MSLVVSVHFVLQFILQLLVTDVPERNFISVEMLPQLLEYVVELPLLAIAVFSLEFLKIEFDFSCKP